MSRNLVRAFLVLMLAAPGIWCLPSALAQSDVDGEDESGDAAADTAGAYGGLAGLLSQLEDAEADSLTALAAELPGGGPFLVSWTREPAGGVRAEVRKIQYSGELKNSFTLKRASRITENLGYTYETFRQQEKTIEKRDNTFRYQAGQFLPFTMSVSTDWHWSEDLTVNSLGLTNLTARDTKNGNLQLSKQNIKTGFLNHKISMNARLDDQQGESQNQRNDSSEGKFSGGLQTGFEAIEGVSIASRVYGQTVSGERALGQVTNPSSASTDTLGIGAYFERGVLSGLFDVSFASFEKRYLDYRRNANGLIDTMDSDVEKIVQELEQKDAIALRWQGYVDIGRFHLKTELGRKTDQHEYLNSGQGLKERLEDTMKLSFGFAVGSSDSFSLRYEYKWRWDDQRLKGAAVFRGRQFDKTRDLHFQWNRQLFTNTSLTTKLHQGLAQSIAQFQYNDNDRDRLSSDFYTQIRSRLGEKFSTTMTFNAKRIEDMSIRSARSSNNNVKDTFEVSPGYQWPLSDWLTLSQTYRMFIQFTDYVFSDLEAVKKDDDYNKRASLLTKVGLTLSERLSLSASHENNAKYDAERTMTDASGRRFYNRNQEQQVTKLDLTLKYVATKWLTVEGATNRTWDATDSFRGTEVNTTDRDGGKFWLGCVLDKSVGKTKRFDVSFRVKKYRAYGPSVREVNADYWDADISVGGKF